MNQFLIDTIVYHADCPDGFCAAFIAYKQYPHSRLVPAVYGKLIDDAFIRQQRVLVVDFSWKREEVLRIAEMSAKLTILDHHQTAKDELQGLDFCVFDMQRSGAQLTWDYLHHYTPRPWYVDYVADRDLWTWKLYESKTISAFIMALPHTMEAWEKLDRMTFNDALVQGRGARAQVEHYVEKVSAQAYKGVWHGFEVAVVNAPYPNISDVANMLCEQGASIGMGWFVRGDGMMQFSLRSIGELDVSIIAGKYGGGGHRNAAGFQLPANAGWQLLNEIEWHIKK